MDALRSTQADDLTTFDGELHFRSDWAHSCVREARGGVTADCGGVASIRSCSKRARRPVAKIMSLLERIGVSSEGRPWQSPKRRGAGPPCAHLLGL